MTVCAFAFAANLALFAVKFYIGLSSNSISIYSDAVNNMFDSLCGLATLICMCAVLGGAHAGGFIRKAEQLFSFVISAVTVGAGLYFGYNSLERLMYPTPVWVLVKHLVLLIATAAAKLLMFFFYRYFTKRSGSPVVRVMAVDSLLDFFITCAATLGLTVSRSIGFAADAVFGLVISAVMTVCALKLLFSCAARLVDFVSAHTREKVGSIVAQELPFAKQAGISYLRDSEEVRALLKIGEQSFKAAECDEGFGRAVSRCRDEAGVKLELLLSKSLSDD